MRVHRDTSYFAYRKASNRRTGYDAQAQQDQLALSLAVVWLQEDPDGHTGRPARKH